MESVSFLVKNSTVREHNSRYVIDKYGRCVDAEGRSFDATEHLERLTAFGSGSVVVDGKTIRLKRERYNDIVQAMKLDKLLNFKVTISTDLCDVAWTTQPEGYRRKF